MKKIWDEKKEQKLLQLLIAWVHVGAIFGGGEDGVEEDGWSRGRGEGDEVTAEGEEEKEMQWQRRERRRRAEGEGDD